MKKFVSTLLCLFFMFIFMTHTIPKLNASQAPQKKNTKKNNKMKKYAPRAEYNSDPSYKVFCSHCDFLCVLLLDKNNIDKHVDGEAARNAIRKELHKHLPSDIVAIHGDQSINRIIQGYDQGHIDTSNLFDMLNECPSAYRLFLALMNARKS